MKYSLEDGFVYRAKMKNKGIELLEVRRSLGRVAVGVVLIAVGVLTLPIPTGSIFLIGAGCGMVGINLFKVWKVFKNSVRRLRWGLR